MKIDVFGDKMIVRANGELDHHYAGLIKNKIDNEIKKGVIRVVIFDFTNLAFMDSSGIGVIMGRYRLMQAIHGRVSVFGAKKRILTLLEMSGITKLISVYDNEQQAMDI